VTWPTVDPRRSKCKLGESLQTPLYVRHGRSLTLTDEGRKVLGFGREQQERTAQLIADIKGTSHDAGVVLAAGEGTFLHLLSEPLRAFQRGNRSKLRVLTRDREHALGAVQLGEAHLAVTVIDDVPPDIISRRVARVGAAVVMPRNHPLARKRSIAIRDLRDEALIAPPAGRPLRATLAQASHPPIKNPSNDGVSSLGAPGMIRASVASPGGRTKSPNRRARERGPLGTRGAPGMIRTCDPRIRSPMLYPAELRVPGEARLIARRTAARASNQPATTPALVGSCWGAAARPLSQLGRRPLAGVPDPAGEGLKSFQRPPEGMTRGPEQRAANVGEISESAPNC
jgi:hypothetical protein